MKKVKEIHLDFVVDKLTNSIQNTISGDSFQTEVARFTLKDSKVNTLRLKMAGISIGKPN
jgi:hypothetical protein